MADGVRLDSTQINELLASIVELTANLASTITFISATISPKLIAKAIVAQKKVELFFPKFVESIGNILQVMNDTFNSDQRLKELLECDLLSFDEEKVKTTKGLPQVLVVTLNLKLMMDAVREILRGIKPIFARILGKIINSYRIVFDALANLATAIGQIDVSDAVKNIQQISVMTSQLFIMCKQLSIIALLAIPAIIGVLTLTILTICLIPVFMILGSKTFEKVLKNVDENIIYLAMVFVILSLIVLLLAVVGAFIILDWETIIMPLVLLIGVVLIMVLFTFLWGLIDKKVMTGVLELSLCMVILSLVVMLLALAGNLVETNFGGIMLSIVVMGLLAGLMFGLGFISPYIIAGAAAMAIMAVAVLIMTLSLVILAVAAMLWDKIGIQGALNILMVIDLFGAAGMALLLVLPGITALILMGLALIPLSIGLIILAMAAKIIDKKTTGKIAAVLGMLIGMFTAAGLLAIEIALGAVAIMLMGTAVITLSIGLILLALAAKLIDKETSGKIAAVLGMLIGMFSAAGLLVVPIALGSVAILLMSEALIVLSVALLMIVGVQKLMPKEDNWFDSISYAVTSMGKLALKSMLYLIPLGLATPVFTLMAIAAGLLAGVAAAVRTVANQKLDELGDSQQISKMLNLPIQGIIDLINTIVAPKNWKLLLKIPIAAVQILMLADIAKALGKMAKIIREIATLTIPVKFDKDGNGVEWTTMKPDDFKRAQENINIVVDTLITAVTDPRLKSKSTRGVQKAKQLFKYMRQICTPISQMCQSLRDIAMLNIPDSFDPKTGEPTKWRQMTQRDFAQAKSSVVSVIDAFIDIIGNEEVVKTKKKKIKQARKKFTLLTDCIEPIQKMVECIKDLANGTVEYPENGATDKEGNVIMHKVGLIKYINENKNAIKNAITNTVSIFTGVIGSIDCSGTSWWDLFRKCWMIEKIGQITEPITNMISIVKDLANGTIEIEDPDKPGKFKKVDMITFLTQNAPKIEHAIENTVKIFTFAVSKIDLSRYEKEIKNSQETFEQLGKVGEGIKPLIESTKELTDLTKNLKVDVLQNNLSAIIQTYVNLAETAPKVDKSTLDNLNTITKSISEFGGANVQPEEQKKAIDNVCKFIDKANSINVDKIKSVTTMVKEMTELSKSLNGNFDKLAEALNGDLLEYLEQLNEHLEDIKKANETAASATETISKATTQTSVALGGQPVADNKNNPQQQVKDVSKILERIQQTLNTISSGVKISGVREAIPVKME